MKKMRALIFKYWRVTVAYLLVIFASAIVLLINLSSQPAHLSSAEVNNLRQSMFWHDIFHNPINLPLHLLERLAFYIAPHNLFILRLPSVIIGIIILCLVVSVVRQWYGLKAAIIAGFLLCSSSIFLADARQATPSILMFGLIIILAIRSWLIHSSRKLLPLLSAFICLALVLYIPGFIWFVAAALIWRYKLILRRLLICNLWQRIVLVVVGVALIAPLVWSVIRLPSNLYTIFGLPRHYDAMIILKNLYHIPLNIFVRSSLAPSQLVPHIPILNIFEICMFILGVYSLWYFRKSERFKAMTGMILLSVLLITIGGAVSINLLLPIIYIVITVGIFYLLENWLYVFPVNPIAKTLGIAVLGCAVGVSCWYHISSYYNAWEHNPSVQIVFNQTDNNI